MEARKAPKGVRERVFHRGTVAAHSQKEINEARDFETLCSSMTGGDAGGSLVPAPQKVLLGV